MSIFVIGLLVWLYFVHISSASTLTPPEGNSIHLVVKARGLQIYKCSSSSTWTLDRAEADLYEDETNFDSFKGFHYFLPKPDAGGGRATWSFQSFGQNVPVSTVTGKIIANESSGEVGTIDQLLVQATSHSGDGSLGIISYIQRIENKGGAAPPASECKSKGLTVDVNYESKYVFWKQEDSVNERNQSSPTFIWFAEGTQNYRFNGTAWSLVNVSAMLAPVPGQHPVAKHYFDNNGLPTWESLLPTFVSTSSVTARPVATIKPATLDAIAWLDLDTSSTTGDNFTLGAIKVVQRLSTRGGLPPSISSTRPPKLGDEYRSPYTAVYWFYSSDNVDRQVGCPGY